MVALCVARVVTLKHLTILSHATQETVHGLLLLLHLKIVC